MHDTSTVEAIPKGRGTPPPLVQEQVPTILVPLDGSVQALAALPVARSLAELVHAPLHLVHIAEPSIHPRELLHKLGLSEDDVRGTVIEQASGDAAASIIRLTRELACAFVVMCPHTGQEEPMGDLGGVARDVLRWSTCPVVLVRPAWNRQQPWGLRHVLVPYDGKPTTAAAFGPALDLAGRADAALVVLHVTVAGTAPPSEPGSITAPLYVDQAHHEWWAWAQEFLQRACCVIPLERMPPLRLALAVGEPGAEIVRSALAHQADLIVLSWHGHLEGEHPCVARAVIREAPCPILMLRASGAG
jgi:nucleotide-binding universal stress UspA family protein